MRSTVRNTLAVIAAIGIAMAGVQAPAQAVTTPTLTIANTTNSLVGSQLSNFDPAITLRLDLSVDTGTITAVLGDSGALVAPDGVLSGSAVAITGTQDQLNAALALSTIQSACSTSRKITATVVPGTEHIVLNPANGHWYLNVGTNGISWDNAKIAADSKTLNGTTGHGYLATITSAAENTFINDHFGGSSMFGASDATTEGDWYWMDGPEAGTKFFSNGAAVNGAFTKWATGEPNDSSNNEDYAQLWGDDTWNDNQGDNSYLVEFGGMTGDDFSSIPFASSTPTLTTEPLFLGAGTKAIPFQVGTSQQLSGVGACQGAGVFFAQTSDIDTAANFSGLSAFSGHYNGNNFTINLANAVNLSGAVFGSVSGAETATDTSITNLAITGAVIEGRGCQTAVLATNIARATIDEVHVTSSDIEIDCRGGLLASTIQDSVISNTSVQGILRPYMFLHDLGGLTGMAINSKFTNVSCNTEVAPSNNIPFIDMFFSFGGCIGTSNNNTYTRVSASGSLFASVQNLDIMDMMEIGGLIGRSMNDDLIESSSTMNLAVFRGYNVGGLLGSASGTDVSRSFSTSNIEASDSNVVGGLVGGLYSSTIVDSYSTGHINARQTAGSIAGNLEGGSTIANSYSTGYVITDDPSGSHGLVGASTTPWITDSFWKINATGVASTVESIGQEVPKFSGDLKKPSTFAAWNISDRPSSDNAWAMCPAANGGYPYLAWQTVPNGCIRSFTAGATAEITGLVYVGNPLTATVTNWDKLAELGYQWQVDGENIAGATAATFTPSAELKGKKLSVLVVGSKDNYVSTLVTSSQLNVNSAPVKVVAVIGGFASKASKVTATTKAATAKLLKGLGTALTIKCEGFAPGKKLSAAQKKLATARAKAVCAVLKVAQANATTTLGTSVAKKTDKLTEGVRVTVTAVKP